MNNLRQLIRNAEASPTIFIGPFFWCLLASFFDGISIGMFVPILKGMIEQDFSFLFSNQYIGPIFKTFPILGTENSIIRPLFFLAMIMTLFFVAKIATIYKSAVSSAQASHLLSHRLRESSFKRCIYLGKGFFDSNSGGQLHTIITQFSGELSWKLTELLAGFTRVFPITFYVAIMFFISWKAAVVTILLSPVALAIRPIYARLSSLSNQNATDHRNVNNNLERVLQGIVTVKANSGEAVEIERFRVVSTDAYNSGVRLIQRLVLSHTLVKLLMLATFVICGAALLFILSDDIRNNVSGYLIYILIMRRSVDVLQQTGHIYGEFKSFSGLIDGINELYSQPLQKFELKDGTISFEGIKEQIQVNNLSFSYGNENVLNNINFKINRGEVVALVGPSGSGKSTIAQLILRLYDLPENTILFDGIDIREYTLKSLREKTAFVSQASNLFDDTLRNNITYGLTREVSDDEIVEALRQAQLSKFFEELPDGLDTRIGERGVRISGGEAQRVAIARAILKNVDFFILDEATSALDASTEKEVQAAIDQLVKDKTVIIIAHRFSTLKNVDRIITVSDGQIIEEGSLVELLEEEGMFAELWKAQELFV